MNKRKFNVVEDKFKKGNNKKIKLPQRSTFYSAGYDFFNNTEKELIIPMNNQFLYWTDIKIDGLNENEYLQIVPRSSLGIKKGIMIANTIGIIDSDYSSLSNIQTGGNIGICLKNTSKEDVIIKPNEALAQGIISQYFITCDDIPKNKERIGGIGSTNND